MYVPKNMAITDRQVISEFIAEFGFGTLVSPDLAATRLPLLYDSQGGTKDIITGHMAKANPQWRQLSDQRVTVMFDGPHSYISPRWYQSRPAVPTWNYASIQCFGTFHRLDDSETRQAVDALVQHYEPDVSNDKTLMSDDYMDKLLTAIVGFRIEVDSIHGKEKLGQHKSDTDQASVFSHLTQSQHSDANNLADYMTKRNLGIGNTDTQE